MELDLPSVIWQQQLPQCLISNVHSCLTLYSKNLFQNFILFRRDIVTTVNIVHTVQNYNLVSFSSQFPYSLVSFNCVKCGALHQYKEFNLIKTEKSVSICLKCVDSHSYSYRSFCNVPKLKSKPKYNSKANFHNNNILHVHSKAVLLQSGEIKIWPLKISNYLFSETIWNRPVSSCQLIVISFLW